MLNSELKELSIDKFKIEIHSYNDKKNKLLKSFNTLYSAKQESLKIIKEIEHFLDSVTNIPHNLEAKIDKTNLNISNFDTEIKDINNLINSSEFKSGIAAGLGILGGAATATLAPSAIMSIVTTFGTASTGTAISSLSGAAATNAALAFVGGGALAAGGGGMVVGEFILSVAVPGIGISIAAVTALSSLIYCNSKNKNDIIDIENKIYEVKKEIHKIDKIQYSCQKIKNDLVNLGGGIWNIFYKDFKYSRISNYLNMSEDEKVKLADLINRTLTLSKYINIKVNME